MKASYQDITEEVRARNDILDVIGSHIQLIRSGSTYKALCPFHKEKTPSFHVNPARQSFHCFGCGKGGDVFRFVMEQENVDFLTALRLLARRAGISFAVTESEKRDHSRKDRLFELHEQAAAFFRRCLLDAPEGRAARDYLAQRQLDGSVSEMFGIGYAPPGPDSLMKWAAAQKWSAEELIASGLVYPGDEGGRSRRPTDRFQNRILFPIWDETGRVIGFSGRVLRKEDHPAKYVNSPETPLFHKSRVLYALHLARRAMATEECAILCEGQIDVIRCHAAGLSHAVAAQGTAVTEDHARILHRYTNEVVLVLDGDAAGETAAVRTAGILLATGLHVRAVALPAGEDPDSFLLKNGAEAMRARVREAPDAVRFVLDGFERRGELTGSANLARAARAALELAARIPDSVPREICLRQAARQLQISEDALRQDLQKMLRRTEAQTVRRTPPQETPAAAPAQDVEMSDIEMATLEHLLRYRDRPAVMDCAKTYLRGGLFPHPVLRDLFDVILRHSGDAEWSPARERPEDAEFSAIAARLEMAPDKPLGDDVTDLDAMRGLILNLWRKRFEQRRIALADARGADGTSADGDEHMELTLQLAALRKGWTSAVPVLEFHLDEI